jgi:hypothetical protein
MSETPETDAVYERVKCSDEDYDAFIDMTHFARQLERQRDEAVECLRSLIRCFGRGGMALHEITLYEDSPVVESARQFLATLDRTEKP